jgi:glutaredoxin 3|tara:strand:+ start:191 stop:448 length:258 start_codon:yes stop_codon:yes gene_type:complete
VKKIELYSTQTCGFCRAAKSLLDDKGISYKEIDISSDPELRGKMVTKANGRRTVPQIFINDAHLGGFSDLYALQQSGTLDKLLRD